MRIFVSNVLEDMGTAGPKKQQMKQGTP